MDYSEIIISQYQAALEMLKQTIAKCPEPVWNSPDDKTKFWHIAYHALFYTHLYLQDSEQTFIPWSKHRKEYQFLGQVPGRPMHRRKSVSLTTKTTFSNILPYVSNRLGRECRN